MITSKNQTYCFNSRFFIGIIIILKQIPHFFGYDAEPEGADSFFQTSSENTFSAIFHIADNIVLGSMIIGFVGLGILILWEKVLSKKAKIFQLVQVSLLIAALSAKGKSVIHNIEQIDRGYEEIDKT